ncbi:hypothetical protein [Streptomyces phytophilus]|uniref:hypothetical protein n=1 Tax=Streptomyces phytophilus TaxID=722715 RepID=UPI0015F0D106|nr:hypothetical protein [Streptomyces phytophilus]
MRTTLHPAHAALLALCTTAAALFITATDANAAETDWTCATYTPAQDDFVLGDNCQPRPGKPTTPVHLYRTGANEPDYLCTTAVLSDDHTHILGIRCTTT